MSSKLTSKVRRSRQQQQAWQCSTPMLFLQKKHFILMQLLQGQMQPHMCCPGRLAGDPVACLRANALGCRCCFCWDVFGIAGDGGCGGFDDIGDDELLAMQAEAAMVGSPCSSCAHAARLELRGDIAMAACTPCLLQFFEPADFAPPAKVAVASRALPAEWLPAEHKSFRARGA